MKSCGIIVEYNPFHNGHMYHAHMARKLSGAEVIIAVMSGNFLQRGEPAIIDKWHRARQALEHGVDIVIELPFAYAVQSADYFAKGGIRLLQAMKCQSICFGTDHTAPFDYTQYGQYIKNNQTRINELFQQLPNQTLSYPQKMSLVFAQLGNEMNLGELSPNHILGLSYAKENMHYDEPMEMYPLKREQAGYHDTTVTGTIASATAIRQALKKAQYENIRSTIPKTTFNDIQSETLIDWENYWQLLHYKLVSTPVNELGTIYQMCEGIEYRIKQVGKNAQSFEEFIGLVKTKRYTQTRLQRLSTYILTNVQQKEIHRVWHTPYLKILGFTPKGRQYLSQHKKKSMLPLITKQSKQINELLQLDQRVDTIYQLGDKSIAEQNYQRQPLQVGV